MSEKIGICSECRNRRDNGVMVPDGLTLTHQGSKEQFGEVSGNWLQRDTYKCPSCNSRWQHLQSRVGVNFEYGSMLSFAD